MSYMSLLVSIWPYCAAAYIIFQALFYGWVTYTLLTLSKSMKDTPARDHNGNTCKEHINALQREVDVLKRNSYPTHMKKRKFRKENRQEKSLASMHFDDNA